MVLLRSLVVVSLVEAVLDALAPLVSLEPIGGVLFVLNPIVGRVTDSNNIEAAATATKVIIIFENISDIGVRSN